MNRGLSFLFFRRFSAGLWPTGATVLASRARRHRPGPGALLVAVLVALVAFVPLVNSAGVPPRSVFLNLPEDQPAPEIEVIPYRLPSGEWQLKIRTEHFQFTTVCVAGAPAAAIGHAHVIRNGVKVASAFHPIVDLGPLPVGRHRITVVLRAQDHRALMANGALVQQKVTITVPRT
ncbi:MAG: hypothetical protein AAFV38_03865 [Pseudomonadota bacterium]